MQFGLNAFEFRSRLVWTGIALCFLLAASTLQAEEPGKTFRAGAAAVEITPQQFPVSMTGSFSDRKATGAHDPLHSRCLVLDDGQTRIAFVVCDSCLISREIFDRAKKSAREKTGIPANCMLMSATHTHTAPTAVPLAQCEPDPEYVAFLTQRITQSVVEANRRLEPARIGWAVAEEPSQVFNRRWKLEDGDIGPNPFGKTDDRVKTNPSRGSDNLKEPAGPTDPEIAFVSLQSRDGRPIALLANYSLHYVGGIPRGSVSADYFGEFARQIRRRMKAEDVDPPFVGILSNGTSGDINNINFRQPRPRSEPFERVKIVAGKVADAVMSEYEKMEHRRWVPLAIAERELELAIRQPSQEEVHRAEEILEQADGPELKTLPEVYARETLMLSEFPETVSLKLQALRIGELGITAIPCEPFVEIGMKIKEKSPLKPTFTIGLANGYNGYLPTPEHHRLGGYETWRSRWSYLEVDASRKIRRTLLEMLNQVARSRTNLREPR